MIELGKVTTVSTEKINPTAHSKTPYIGLEHINRDLGTINGQGTASEIRSTKSVFRKGDLLYGKLRPYLNKVWVAQFDGVCSTDILVYPQNESVDNEFLKYRFMTSDFVRYASENSNGVNLPRVNAKALARFPIWLPPLPDQHRIVAEIEKQFTRLDAGVTALKRVQSSLKRYRASVLKSACEGRLIPTEAELARKENRPYETGAQLLSRILATRRQNWQGRGKYKEPVAPDTSNLPLLPEGWTWATGEMLFTWASGEGLTQKQFQEGRFPVYGGNGITGYHNAHIFSVPTIVIGRVGALCGNVYVTSGPAWITDNAIYANSLSPFVDIKYAHMVFTQANLNKRATGSGQPFVNQKMLNETIVPLPSLMEQQRIIEEIERRLSVADRLETLLTTNSIRANRIRQSILQKVFQ